MNVTWNENSTRKMGKTEVEIETWTDALYKFPARILTQEMWLTYWICQRIHTVCNASKSWCLCLMSTWRALSDQATLPAQLVCWALSLEVKTAPGLHVCRTAVSFALCSKRAAPKAWIRDRRHHPLKDQLQHARWLGNAAAELYDVTQQIGRQCAAARRSGLLCEARGTGRRQVDRLIWLQVIIGGQHWGWIAAARTGV